MRLSTVARQKLVEAVDKTWNAIAYDVLQATADATGKPIGSVTFSRAEVAEMVYDYLEVHGGITDPELKRLVRSWAPGLDKAIEKCLTFSKYGI